MTDSSSQLIEALKDPGCWPDSPERVECVETHISWVLLTREFAWKIRKPVAFDFLDFSTLDLREHFSHEEVRINRRTAPGLYLDVVPICGNVSEPVVDGAGPPIEYAVQMRRFEQSQLLSTMAANGDLTPRLIDSLATSVAAFHQSLPPTEFDSPYGRGSDIRNEAIANFTAIEQFADEVRANDTVLHYLQDWTEAESDRLAEVFEQRRRDGFVRECHGDLHLGNIVALETGPCAFDCLEFNEHFRWTDVISEVAFLVMDLEEHDLPRLARRFLNRYLERTGDYAGLELLRFYIVYRAMIRAKVDMIRLHEHPTASQRRFLINEFGSYVTVADHDAAPLKPAVVLMHGYSGSGKTTVSQHIVEATPAVRVRSDIERKRLYGIAETARDAESDLVYSDEASRRTYDRLLELAETTVRAGFGVVVDAAFLQRHERSRFRKLARRLNVPFRIVACTAPGDQLTSRVRLRQIDNADASDADVRVVQRQLQADTGLDLEPPNALLRVDTSNDTAIRTAVRKISGLLKSGPPSE